MFWIITAALALVVAFWISAVLMRRAASDVDAPEAYDIEVYRAQLSEVERDLERGIVSADEAQAIRTEVSRRLLSADSKLQTAQSLSQAPRNATQLAAVVGGVGVIGGAFGLYMLIGAPGYGDLPHTDRVEAAALMRAERPSQADAVTEANLRGAPQVQVPEGYMDLVTQLRTAVANRPDDVQGLTLLVGAEARLGNFEAAAQVQEQLIAAKGDKATADDLVGLADFMVIAAGGYVSPEVEAVLNDVIKLDRNNGPARYYTGRMFAQTGRPDLAFSIWRALLEESAPNDPWVGPIREEISMMAMRAGVDYELPAPASGPSQEAIAEAQDMTPEERMDMIRGMVGGLNDRLATEGGTPADWARLIGAYGVLGETENAAKIWENAQASFADAPQALAAIREAAIRAGVAQ